MIKADVTSETSAIFREMLKMRRREMNPGNRARSRAPAGSTWLYPHGIELQYKMWARNLMDVYSDIAIPAIQRDLNDWVKEQKGDGARKDDFETDIQRLTTELEQTQHEMFSPDGEGVEDNKGRILSFLTISAALKGFGTKTAEFNDKQMGKVTKPILGVPFLPTEPWLPPVVNQWSQANFTLIKSLSGEYIKKVNTIVADGVADGLTREAIMTDVRKMDKNMTRARADLIARDQIGKLNGRLSKRRMQEAGLDLYTWRTAGDERVRPSHKALNNKTMRWDDSSKYSEDGGKTWKSRSSIGGYIGIPGQDVQCRCTPVPRYDEMIQEIDQELLEEAA